MPDKTVPVLFTGKFDLSLHEARLELTEILQAGARGLKPAGTALLPIKPEMLPHPDRDLILEALNLLFAAILSYEAAQWTIGRVNNPVDLVTARIDAGSALGVIEALFYGPTRQLFALAMELAPIAYYALSEASPDLHIIDRTIRRQFRNE